MWMCGPPSMYPTDLHLVSTFRLVQHGPIHSVAACACACACDVHVHVHVHVHVM